MPGSHLIRVFGVGYIHLMFSHWRNTGLGSHFAVVSNTLACAVMHSGTTVGRQLVTYYFEKFRQMWLVQCPGLNQ